MIIFATRPSALARWQTKWVMRALGAAWPGLECRERVIATRGDQVEAGRDDERARQEKSSPTGQSSLASPLPAPPLRQEIGGKGMFTQELEAELLSGRVHAAVHSLKDLPVEEGSGLTVGAIPARAEPRDVLISARGYALATLPDRARVGTSSLRRTAQLLAARSDLRIEPLRGNVDTRLRKALHEEYDAIVLAGAGIIRLGLERHVTGWLPLEVMLPAPGQGALAVQCRADDAEVLSLLAALEDPLTRVATTAERAFLSSLGGSLTDNQVKLGSKLRSEFRPSARDGSCAVPVAAYATTKTTGVRQTVHLKGLVASPDGRRVIRVQGMGTDPLLLGAKLASEAIEQGASEILSLVTPRSA